MLTPCMHCGCRRCRAVYTCMYVCMCESTGDSWCTCNAAGLRTLWRAVFLRRAQRAHRARRPKLGALGLPLRHQVERQHDERAARLVAREQRFRVVVARRRVLGDEPQHGRRLAGARAVRGCRNKSSRASVARVAPVAAPRRLLLQSTALGGAQIRRRQRWRRAAQPYLGRGDARARR